MASDRAGADPGKGLAGGAAAAHKVEAPQPRDSLAFTTTHEPHI